MWEFARKEGLCAAGGVVFSSFIFTKNVYNGEEDRCRDGAPCSGARRHEERMKRMTTNLPLAPGVTLRAIRMDKFKTACFSVNFVRQHTKESAAADALLPSVLLRATERYPDIRSISERMDELYGASFGTLVRRKGEVKLIGFYADFIEDDFAPAGANIFPQMVDFLEDVLYRPLTENGVFSARAVEGEKQNLTNAIEAAMNDKRSYAVTRMLQIMCRDEAYGVPRLGTVEDVAAITPQSLWAHYQEMLTTSRIEIFYAGRRTPEEAAREFSRVLAARAPQFCAPYETKVLRRAEEVRECSEAMDVTQGKLVIGLRTGITVSDEAYPALLLLNAIYGASVSSKLFINLREKRSLCYYANSSLEKYKGIMIVTSGISFEQMDTAKNAILHELEDCKNGVISEEELDSARRQLLSALRAAMDAPAQMDDFYCGIALSGGDDYDVLMEKLAALSVQDVQAAAKKLSLDTVYFLRGAEA